MIYVFCLDSLILIYRYSTFFEWRKPKNDGSVLPFANQVLHTLRCCDSLALMILGLQNVSAYSGKFYGEGSQHGLHVEFDFRRFIIVVDELLHSKRGGNHVVPEDL